MHPSLSSSPSRAVSLARLSMHPYLMTHFHASQISAQHHLFSPQAQILSRPQRLQLGTLSLIRTCEDIQIAWFTRQVQEWLVSVSDNHGGTSKSVKDGHRLKITTQLNRCHIDRYRAGSQKRIRLHTISLAVLRSYFA